MRVHTIGMLLFVILGGSVLPVSIGGGLALWGVAYLCSRGIRAADEEQFVAWLMFLAGLGAVIPTALELLRLTAGA